jgi:glycosyltransferase involved in cell wall biosynthesis
MKVVHLCTSVNSGGAAVAMRGLHEALLASGQSSQVLGCHGTPDPAAGVSVEPAWHSPALDIVEETYVYDNRTELSNTHFSLDLWGASIHRDTRIREADIIHLHWVAEFLSTRSLREIASLGKPVCWTAHDMRPITGGCHFSAGCEGYLSLCTHCPQLREDPLQLPLATQQAMAAAIGSLNATLVAPSRWLQNEIQRSVAARGRAVEHIPYGVNLDTFQPSDKDAARQRLNMASAPAYILLGAHDFRERRKGLPIAIEILERIGRDPECAEKIDSGQWKVVCAGDSAPAEIGRWKVERLGYLTSQRMADLYAAADLFLFTADEDNLPNTILEAMASGLPVVAQNVGGVPDMVVPGSSGVLFPIGDSGAAADALGDLLGNSEKRRTMGCSARQLAQSGFSPERQAQAYIALYEQMLSNKSARGLAPIADVLSEAAVDAPGIALLWQKNKYLTEMETMRRDFLARIDLLEQGIEKMRSHLEEKDKAMKALYKELDERQLVIDGLKTRIEFLEKRMAEIAKTKWFAMGSKLGLIHRSMVVV